MPSRALLTHIKLHATEAFKAGDKRWTNPFHAVSEPKQWIAWDTGWTEAERNAKEA